MSLQLEEDLIPNELSVRGEIYTGAGYSAKRVEKADLEAFSAYDLPSVQALVKYFHAADGTIIGWDPGASFLNSYQSVSCGYIACLQNNEWQTIYHLR